MNLSRHNLQEFCRICLVKFRQTADPKSYNIFLLPHLAKLIMIFTAFNLEDEEHAEMPHSLCVMCYNKLTDLQDFRYLAKKSTQILNDLLKSVDVTSSSTKNVLTVAAVEDDEAQKTNENAQSTETANTRNTAATAPAPDATAVVLLVDSDDENNDVVELVDDTSNQQVADDVESKYSNNIDNNALVANDDNQLLLPELATLIVKQETQLVATTAEDTNLHIKMELDSDCDELQAADTIADDADDEEHALRNGAANNSSNSTSKSDAPVRRVRDRSKKAIKCPRCDKMVYKQVYMDAHIRGVHEGHDKPFLCLQCNKAFTRYHQLHEHIKMHHPMEQAKFVCEFEGCQASFKMNGTLETHRRVVHAAQSAPFSMSLEAVIELHQQQLSQEIEMDHICQLCFKKYSSKRALGEHLKRHAQIKNHACKVCGVAKVTRTELQTHMRTHEQNLTKFKCTICPQEFNHKNAISRHVRVVHEGQRNFSCKYCSKRFGTRNSQVCHERLHTGERPFNCEYCNKCFAQQEGLNSHMKNHNKMLRKHICKFCSKRFITRKNLEDHEERHRGSKPYICNTCSRGFFLQEDLQIHNKAHEDEAKLAAQTAEDVTSAEWAEMQTQPATVATTKVTEKPKKVKGVYPKIPLPALTETPKTLEKLTEKLLDYGVNSSRVVETNVNVANVYNVPTRADNTQERFLGIASEQQPINAANLHFGNYVQPATDIYAQAEMQNTNTFNYVNAQPTTVPPYYRTNEINAASAAENTATSNNYGDSLYRNY